MPTSLNGLQGVVRGRPGGAAEENQLGFPFILLLVWFVFEFARPSQTFGIPALISLTSGGLWLARADKRLSSTTTWWFVLLAVIVIGVPLASNTMSAYTTARLMTILFLTVCLPLLSVLTTLKRYRVWIYVMLAVLFYVGVHATGNGGYGPAGEDGQDENYVAAMMCMAIPFAYFSLYSEKRKLLRIGFVVAIAVFVAAMALADNASRGGFLALCVVGMYCLARSPRKMVGLSVLAVGAIALAVVAGESFWAEIGTSADYTSGTGDLRLEAWKSGFRMWLANPIFGVGAGNFAWELGNFESAAQVAHFGRSLGGSMVAHSLWVELVTELGLVGLVATLVLTINAWFDLERVRRATVPVPGRVTPDLFEIHCYSQAVQAAILAIAVNGIFLSLMYYSHLWLLIVMATALPHILNRRLAMSGGHAHPPPAPGRRGGRRRRRPSPRMPRRPHPNMVRRRS